VEDLYTNLEKFSTNSSLAADHTKLSEAVPVKFSKLL
jgi:hypothetical protein